MGQALSATAPSIAIRGTPYPVLLPKLRDPRLHLAATITSLQVIGQIGVPLRGLDRADPARPRHVRRARGGDRVPEPARDHVAGERDADRERRGVRPARPGHRARRLVEPARLVDLRRNGRDLAPLEARDQVARRAHLQPVEHRPRHLLPRARAEPRGAARLLVGADVGVARARARHHRQRRLRDPVAAQAPARRARLLGVVRRRHRRARARGSLDDRALAPRPDLAASTSGGC